MSIRNRGGGQEEKWKKKENDEVDYLSNLVDELVAHILSYVPFRDAVRTSILSRRWRGLWTYITSLESLDIDQTSCWRRQKLPSHIEQTTYIDGVISAVHRLSVPSIKEINFTVIGHQSNFIKTKQDSFMQHSYRLAISRLRDLLLTREVRHLYFSGVEGGGTQVCLSDIVAEGAKSIVSIEAQNCYLRPYPSPSSAPEFWARLKVLKLNAVAIPINFQGIIDACTNIEIFHLYPTNILVVITALTFKSLTLRELMLKIYDKGIFSSPINFHIDAPNMQLLSFHGSFRLGKLYIHGGDGMSCGFHLTSITAERSIQGFLRGSANASQLNLGNTLFQYLTKAEALVAKFVLLRSLRVVVDTEDMQEASALIALLHQCPSLKQLHISVVKGKRLLRYRMPPGLRVFSSHLSRATFIPHHLQTVTLENFTGEPNLLDLATHFLQNGEALATFNVSLKENASPRDRKEMHSLKRSFPNTTFNVMSKQLLEKLNNWKDEE